MTNNHSTQADKAQSNVTITRSQAGVVGDHAHVEGGIHHHPPRPHTRR